VLIFFTYSVYLIYYEIFKVPLSLYSIKGAQDAFQFKSVVYDALLSAIVPMILFLLPVAASVYLCLKLGMKRIDKRQLIGTVILIIVSFIVSIGAVGLTKNKHNSPYMLYYKIYSPELSLGKLGLLTTIRLDLQKLIAEQNKTDDVIEAQQTTTVTTQRTTTTTSAPSTTSETAAVTTTTEVVTETEPMPEFNVMDIDFQTLADNESNETIRDMHNYFSSLDPSRTNEYTGIFKGHNLILIVAESFYPYAIREDLTPTLYMMANEGFVFNNFYNPLFGVSTSDGEYVACEGLLPKPGVWSFYISGRNYMPFAFGNQLRALGYITKAYHNHTYTYYNRDKSFLAQWCLMCYNFII
jgi:lipoteichoic acid synthase